MHLISLVSSWVIKIEGVEKDEKLIGSLFKVDFVLIPIFPSEMI